MSVKEKVMDAGQTVKDKAVDAGHAVAETAKNVGQKIAGGASQATDWVQQKTGIGMEGKDLGVAGIKEHMDVIASCGHKIGVVDRLEGNTIKLTKNDSNDGQHHFIPTAWVERVDGHVHLTKNSVEATQQWKTDAASCGTCG